MTGILTALVQSGVLTPDRAREARRHQVVFGDRIGTNLLALGFVTETTLAQALGGLWGVPWAAGATADTKPALTRSLPRGLAARLSAVPAAVEAEGVSLFMTDPVDAASLTELAAHYNRPVRGIAVVEGRMWALLNKFYLVRRGMRALQLDGDTGKRTTLVSKATERRASSVATTVTAAGASTTSLTPLTPLTPLTSLIPTPSLASQAAPVAPAVVVDEEPPWLAPVGGGALRPTGAPSSLTMLSSPPPPPPPSASPARPTFAEADVSLDELMAATGDDEDALLLGDVVEDEAPFVELDEGERDPLSFAEAKGLLASVIDRNQIARIVLRHAISRARRSLLLTVESGAATPTAMGWDALGEGLAPGLAHDVCLSLQTPSALQLAHDTRGHVLGPLTAGGVNEALSALLGGAPKTAFVAPILARGVVVNLLYLDDGPGRFMPPDIGELLILCQHINKSYDALLAQT